jgi:hypothetical protein
MALESSGQFTAVRVRRIAWVDVARFVRTSPILTANPVVPGG